MISKHLLVPLTFSTLSMPVLGNQRPNIILFLVDDMGWQETSVPFWKERTPLNDRYRTPNMERLAQMGVKFTQAYAYPISSPSRCSLLSGMNAARHKVTNWTLRYNQETDGKNDEIIPPQWNCNGLQPDTVTSSHDRHRSTLVTALPQILKDNGYYTIHCGKAHFAAETTAGENPTNFGFMVNIAGGANGAPASYLAEDNYGTGAFHVKGLEQYYEKGLFLTEALTQEAIKAMTVPISQKRPFFLYMSHYAIHIPYTPDSRFVDNYRDNDGEGIHDKMLGQRLNEQEINHAALIEGMDKSLGDIIDFIQQDPEVGRNTIIMFMSDNGGQAVSVRQGKENHDQNYPARGGKGSALEGGIHEPMLVSWPGTAKGGTININRIMIEDFFPTILDMAGVKGYHTTQIVDGISFADIIKDTTKHRDREIIWHYPNLWTDNIDEENGYGPSSSIMKGDYHFIYYWKTGKTALYNNQEDIAETNNLARQMPKLAKKMKKRLFRMLNKMNAQYPRLVKH